MSESTRAGRAGRASRDITPTAVERCPHICIGCEEICKKHLGATAGTLEAHLPSARPQSRFARWRQMLLLLAQSGDTR